MFDFLDSDWFIIGLEIVFLIFIIYDIKKYIDTKKKEYITNIVLTIGFAIWTLLPFYKSYFEWNEAQKNIVTTKCLQDNNSSLCDCLTHSTFKEYTYFEYKNIDKNSTDYLEFVKDTREDCLDDGWF